MDLTTFSTMKVFISWTLVFTLSIDCQLLGNRSYSLSLNPSNYSSNAAVAKHPLIANAAALRCSRPLAEVLRSRWERKQPSMNAIHNAPGNINLLETGIDRSLEQGTRGPRQPSPSSHVPRESGANGELRALAGRKRAELRNPGATRKYLVVQPEKDRKARKGYYAVDDESLFMHWASLRKLRVHKLLLGYDDHGRVYDVYQQMPSNLDVSAVFKTIRSHIIWKIMKGEQLPFDDPQLFHPASIAFFPQEPAEPCLISLVRIESHRVEISQRPVFNTSSSTLPEFVPF